MDEVLKIALKTSPFVTPITAYKKIATKKRK
jgi:hypothetical protein